MKIFEAINQMRYRLPLERAGRSFVETLQNEFSEYISLLNGIDESDFNTLFSKEGSPIIINLTKRKFISFIEQVQNTINSIIDVYYEGYPDEAYKLLENLLVRNKFAPKRKGVSCAYANNYLNDRLGNFFLLGWKEELVNLYRMRISDTPLAKEELFHVPFNMSERAATARFSIPGFPCLYFGTSLKVCWNEITRPLKTGENVYACSYQNQKSLSFVNLTIPEECPETILDADPYFALSFLATYPFYLSCLIKVEYPDGPFKPEYIIPQLLLQYVKKQDMIDGIIYSSTKNRILVGEKYYNIVIPARKMAATGHCHKLKTWCYTTESICVDIANISESEIELNSLTTSVLL